MVVVAMDEGEAHGYGHGWLGEMIGDFGDVLTMSRRVSNCSSSDRNALWLEINVGLTPWLVEEENEAWGRLLQLRRGGGVGKLAGDDLHHGCSRERPPPLLLFLPLLLLSLQLSLSCSLVSNVNGKEDEGERGLMGFVRWSADMWGRVVCVCV